MTDVEMNQNRRPLETQVDRALHASESLEFYARQVAEAHSVSSSLRPRRYLLADLGRQRAFLRTAYDYFREAGEELLAASYAAEWLLDNFYLVERALRLLREDMPEHYYRQLPLLKNSPMAGLPRVYALAHHIVHYTQGSLEREAIERFLHAYQSVTPLAMGEIWALPLMLRLASIENTLRAIARVTDLEAPPIEDAPGDYLAQELSDDLIVGNSIHSLRVLDTVDWETFFDNVSRVEQILRRDPGNIYARMDFETRNQYRRVIEDIARAAGTDERVAHIAVNLAEMRPPTSGVSRVTPGLSISAAMGTGISSTCAGWWPRRPRLMSVFICWMPERPGSRLSCLIDRERSIGCVVGCTSIPPAYIWGASPW